VTTHALQTVRRTVALVALPVLAATLVVAAPVAARTPVDPNTLNPAPPDFFNAECWEGATGTVCTLFFSDDPIVDEPSGIVCGGTELLFSQTRSVTGKRYYDADGNLVQRHFIEQLAGVLTNPDNGKSVPWVQHDTVIHNLVTPGDVDSGPIRFTGLMTRVWLGDGGTVLIAAGTQVQDLASGAVIKEGGPHPFDRYFVDGEASALQPICDALD
jgi:hypothetical protein